MKLLKQTRTFKEVIVVVRDLNLETRNLETSSFPKTCISDSLLLVETDIGDRESKITSFCRTSLRVFHQTTNKIVMTITVVVPTYRRPQDLYRCLEALKNQTCQATEIIVTVRDIDVETWEFLKTYERGLLPLKTVTVSVTGVIAAMNAAVAVARGEIIAFTDDDAAPHPDWLQKINAHFMADEKVAGVGGKDFMYENGQLVTGKEEIVGKIQWFGRTIGNHHVGIGEAREVEVLKGVNMSFRRSVFRDLKFDTRMLGTGAQVHFEIAFCTKLILAGWKLIYDPEILVDHYRAQRFDEDMRHQFNEVAWFNEVHNLTLALLEYLPPSRRNFYLAWSVLVGTRKGFGLVQLLRFFPQDGSLAVKKWLLSVQGRWQAWLNWRSGIVSN